MQQSRRGRTRSEEARAAILRATRDELMANGYDKLSIDRVAAAAGTGKQTVYRWYPAKSALVADCIIGGYLLSDLDGVVDTGDIRLDLRDWVRAYARYAGDPHTSPLVRAAAAAAAESEEVAARMYEHVTSVAETALTERLRTAARDGQLLAADSAVPLLSQALIGAVLYRLLTRLPLTPDFADDLVSSVCGFPATAAPASQADPPAAADQPR